MTSPKLQRHIYRGASWETLSWGHYGSHNRVTSIWASWACLVTIDWWCVVTWRAEPISFPEFEDFLIILGLSRLPLGNFTHKLGWTKSSQRKLFSLFGHQGAEGLMVICCMEKGEGSKRWLKSWAVAQASYLGLGFQKKPPNKGSHLSDRCPRPPPPSCKVSGEGRSLEFPTFHQVLRFSTSWCLSLWQCPVSFHCLLSSVMGEDSCFIWSSNVWV